eukprot:gnl/TRDRNA2_/TRDRNA2_162437_c1_seq1.p1 gnl/TRDRNA2_/TRDRNA2_162437_c1~~gnl/TRDRNA2_/TRDRNA2_162437_c1_seq1.p1  ORF type:complete len:226 (+),score=50.23 gnl/TRDRNA2_/TRDRNA2_162437_c1_seq1:299-976(+)
MEAEKLRLSHSPRKEGRSWSRGSFFGTYPTAGSIAEELAEGSRERSPSPSSFKQQGPLSKAAKIESEILQGATSTLEADVEALRAEVARKKALLPSASERAGLDGERQRLRQELMTNSEEIANLNAALDRAKEVIARTHDSKRRSQSTGALPSLDDVLGQMKENREKPQTQSTSFTRGSFFGTYPMGVDLESDEVMMAKDKGKKILRRGSGSGGGAVAKRLPLNH